jgi:hypothetical protein
VLQPHSRDSINTSEKTETRRGSRRDERTNLRKKKTVPQHIFPSYPFLSPPPLHLSRAFSSRASEGDHERQANVITSPFFLTNGFKTEPKIAPRFPAAP